MLEQDVQSLPLQGKRILVTRTHEQASAFSERLKALGAIPIEFPTIRIAPPHNWAALDAALAKLFLTDAQGRPYYTWLIFTSVNAVNICCARLQHLKYDLQTLSNLHIAAIGPATAAALAHYGLTADLVPHEYVAEAVASALIKHTHQRGESLQGKRILLPRAAEARKVLVTQLQHAGALVDEVAAYHTLPVANDDEHSGEILHLLQNHQLDIITFTSSSTVRNFVQWLAGCTQANQEHVVAPIRGVEGGAMGNVATPLGGVVGLGVGDGGSHPKIACIGPITAQTARELGFPVHIQAQEFTIDGLIQAILETTK